MEVRSVAANPVQSLTTPAAAAPAAENAAPADEVVIQSNLLQSGTRFHVPTPPELAAGKGYPKKEVPDGSKRIDSVREVLQMEQVWNMGYTGKGVAVAVIDTGTYPHEDYKSRLVAFKDMVNDRPEAYDDNGHGTHCAGLVLGDGKMAGGKFRGPAYEADLVGIKVLSGEGGGAMSDVIRGIEWAVANKDRYNIKVVSLSLGAPAFQKEKFDLVAKAVGQAYDAGILPVIAAGNSGPFLETIGTPAIAQKGLTVGAYDDKNTPNLADDTMAFFSSRGPTTRDRTIKPDIASPGVQQVSTLSHKSMIAHENVPRYGDEYILLSGTSMATPIMAGVAAVLFQVNPNLTPREAIDIVKSTARPIADTNPLVQGAGLVDPVAAVKETLARKAAAEAAQAAPQAKAEQQPQPEAQPGKA